MSSQALLTDDVKQKIMNDPRVQNAIEEQVRKTGESAAEALKDPVVQQQIAALAAEKFPQYAAQAKDAALAYANDPAVQARAKALLGTAGAYVMGAGGSLVATIQQGPAGVRLLSFIGGAASCYMSVMAVINPLGVLTGFVTYVLSAYQAVFALTTMMFEAKPEWIQQIPGLNQYQDLLMHKASFLADTNGRGIFYIYQGTLWLMFFDFSHWLQVIVGAWMFFVGVLNLSIHYGGYSILAKKISEGYSRIGGQAASSADQP